MKKDYNTKKRIDIYYKENAMDQEYEISLKSLVGEHELKIINAAPNYEKAVVCTRV